MGVFTVGIIGQWMDVCEWVYKCVCSDGVVVLQRLCGRCSVLQRVAACCSVLQCVQVCCSVLQCVAVCCRRQVEDIVETVCVAAVCCSCVLQLCVAAVKLRISSRLCVCCSVLQCVAV